MMKRVLLGIGAVTVIAALWWAVSAVHQIQANARTAKFNTDIENLFVALQQFKENVGSYPIGSNAQIAKALRGQNPKNVIILVGRKSELNEKGEFVDPWGTPLRIYFCDTGVLIRSAGPNKRFDDSTVMNCDDFFRSN